MLISLEWLSDYVDISNISAEKFENEMVLSGTNSEGAINTKKHIDNVVVTQIVDIKKHPEADRLFICMAKLGEDESDVIQVLTAAKNMKVGDYVPLAKSNSVLADGSKIKKSKMRGEVSNGMFCSYQELGFSENVIPKEDLDGLLVFKEKFAYDQPIVDALKLDDTVIDFEITPNRSDCLSVIGIAKEAAATFDIEFKREVHKLTTEYDDVNNFASVEVLDNEICNRYSARVITDVKIEPSPMWMQIRLMKAGIRPHNNIVDITNYVMLEYGQPIHAFDLDKLEEKKIIVRKAKKSEKMITLDAVERSLDSDMLVICDAKQPVAIAGVMGGEFSGISNETKNLLIEVANFDKSSIRETSKKLGLRSESSSRYEKGVSPDLVPEASMRICELVEKLNCGRVVKGIIDFYENPKETKTIELRVDRVEKILGEPLNAQEISKYLTRLECKVEMDSDVLKVSVPHYRLDLLTEIDLIEEVARIYGYNNLKSELCLNETVGGRSPRQNLNGMIKEFLVGFGLQEVVSYSFMSPKVLSKLQLSDNHEFMNLLTITNPLGEEYSIMRPTLISNMLNMISYNFRHKAQAFRAFEIGNVFNKKDEKYDFEREKLCIAICSADDDFYSLKSILDRLFTKINLLNVVYKTNTENPLFHTGRCADLKFLDDVIGTIGEIHPVVLDNFGISKRCYVVELDMNLIFTNRVKNTKYTPLPTYPAATRDIAIIVDDEVTNGDIVESIKSSGAKYLYDLSLFDVYRGEQLEKGKKSMAYALSFRSSDATLNEEEIQKDYNTILKRLSDDFNAKLR